MPANAPIRVLHIITRLSVGGAQENTLLSVEGIDRDPEIDCQLLTGTDDGTEGSLIPRAEKTTRLVQVPELGREVNPLLDFTSFLKLYRVIKQGRYHIVHTHMSKAGVVGRWAARFAGTPIIIHSIHGLAFGGVQDGWKGHMFGLIERFCGPITDHFISVSQVLADRAAAAGVGPKERFSTVYSGMELDWFLNAQVDRDAIRREFGLPL
ncbi:MAG: glycosyltransferase family 4 protein, partial [Armatimonadetes bacterium]|nr:glycosyltransferase family 4 protein [Armatimonadota bacterium]